VTASGLKNDRTARIGVIGCGNISAVYLKNLTQAFRNTTVVAVSDLSRARAEERAAEFGIPAVCDSTEQLLGRDDVDIVLNLTIPSQHAAVSRAALEAGRHVYSEKPLATNLEDGAMLLRLAAERGLLLGCAPDTIFGASFQMGRRLIDDGWIGTPFAATALQMRSGPEAWHPDPAFLYQEGAGTIFDDGPYVVTVLAYLLGPVAKVTASGITPYAERTVASGPRSGEKFPVEVPTFVTAQLSFATGALVSVVMTLDVGNSRMFDAGPLNDGVEIYGTDGTLTLPGPGSFDGSVFVKRDGAEQWVDIPSMYRFSGNARGVGVSEMAGALLHSRPSRIPAELAFHALEVMLAMDHSWQTGERVDIQSTVPRLAPLSDRLGVGEIEDPVPMHTQLDFLAGRQGTDGSPLRARIS
jgi:predicted dehydrogenase